MDRQGLRIPSVYRENVEEWMQWLDMVEARHILISNACELLRTRTSDWLDSLAIYEPAWATFWSKYNLL